MHLKDASFKSYLLSAIHEYANQCGKKHFENDLLSDDESQKKIREEREMEEEACRIIKEMDFPTPRI